MLFIEFNETNYHILAKLINQGNKIFLLVYSNSCGACKDVLPEWDKLGVLSSINTNAIIIAKLRVSFSNKNILQYFPRIKQQGNGVPKILFIDGFKEIKSFTNTNRNATNIIQWIYEILLNY